MLSRLHIFSFLVFFALTTYVGCSKVRFKTVPSFTCQNFNNDGNTCTACDNGDCNIFTSRVKAGRVDILFINDNSGSMSVEQGKMADRFPMFISGIDNLDYQIAMITTDVSISPGNQIRRAANGNGAFQDGQFLWFQNNSGDLVTKVLTSETDSLNDRISYFQNTVQRQETITCDNSNYTNCPSGDERAIYAANLAFDRQELEFYRPGAHLALVILSDEDERSNGGGINGYPLEEYDMPGTLVDKLSLHFGPTKTMSVHAVSIAPGDTVCHAQQNQQARVRGFYSNTYSALVNPDSNLRSLGGIIDGEQGSICANDYGAQLGNIANKISDNVQPIKLVCDPLEPPTVTFEGGPAVSWFVDSENFIQFDDPVPAETTVVVTVKCPTYI